MPALNEGLGDVIEDVEMVLVKDSAGSIVSLESGRTHITTKSEAAGKRRVYNVNDIYRYGNIESAYMSQTPRQERIKQTFADIESSDAYFMTEPDVKGIKKAFRLTFGQDNMEQAELDLKDYPIKLCKAFIPIPEYCSMEPPVETLPSDSTHRRRTTKGVAPDQFKRPVCDFCHEPEDNGVHITKRRKPEGYEWNIDVHPSKVPTNAFGHIDFRYANRAQFMRISDDTSLPKVLDMMVDYWGMKPPGVIVALIGKV